MERICLGRFWAGILLVGICSGCGLIRQATVSEMYSEFGGEKAISVYLSDDDPELVWEALPFGLKATEMMLAHAPENQELCLAAAKGFVMYAQGCLAQRARKLESRDFYLAMELRDRAHKLSLRGRDYALRALDARYTGFSVGLRTDREKTLARLDEDDVPLLFWAAAGWAGATASDQNDMERMDELPIAEAIMKRALTLNDKYGDGAIQEFFIAYEAARAPTAGGSFERAGEYFERAVRYSLGKKASPYVVFAETVAVRRQDRPLFRDLLARALAVNVSEKPDWRLANTLAQDRARWLLKKEPDLFLTDPNEQEETP